VLGFVLVVLTLVLYWPATRYEFVNLDDNLYVFHNPWVTKGLSFDGLKWALTSLHIANWHPLTWVSHMLDCSFYGLFAGGHHLTNIIFHALNALLLFRLLLRITQRLWPGFLVAALFAWHPLHVESVAWVSERKDVLSTLFFLLSLGAYARYVEKTQVSSPKVDASGCESQVSGFESQVPNSLERVAEEHRGSKLGPAALFYVLSLVLFALGLMAKAMLVTLPFVLVLMDYWPLKRIVVARGYGRFKIPIKLFLEKIPFFALSVGVCVITLHAQQVGGAVRTVVDVPIFLRLINALSAYCRYLLQMICPADLCIFYPMPDRPSLGLGICCALVLGAISWWVYRTREAQRWTTTGWLWFLGTLVPVIGLVAVGSQAMADRYTYVPSIGLFIAVVWSVDYAIARTPLSWEARAEPHAGRHVFRLAAPVMVGTVLVVLVLSTRSQLAYWQNSIVLFSRAVAVTEDNAFAQNSLGVALEGKGKTVEAIQHYREAVRIKPADALLRNNLALALTSAGKSEESTFHFSEGLKYHPDNAILHQNLGVVLTEQGKIDTAIEHLRRAIQLDPLSSTPYLSYGTALQKLGKASDAVTNYSKALQLNPDWPEALDRLAYVLATCPERDCKQPDRAVRLAERAVELTKRTVPTYLETLALAYAAAGQFSDAIAVANEERTLAARKDSNAINRISAELEIYKARQTPRVDWRELP
jgi:Flp pilus assembly protein TadD